MPFGGPIEFSPAEVILIVVLVFGVPVAAVVGVVLLGIAGYRFLRHRGDTTAKAESALRRAAILAIVGALLCLPMAWFGLSVLLE